MLLIVRKAARWREGVRLLGLTVKPLADSRAQAALTTVFHFLKARRWLACLAVAAIGQQGKGCLLLYH